MHTEDPPKKVSWNERGRSRSRTRCHAARGCLPPRLFWGVKTSFACQKKCSHMWELGGGLFSEFFPPFPFSFGVTSQQPREGKGQSRSGGGKEGDSSLGPQQAGDTSSPGSAPSLLLGRRRHHARGGTMGGKRKRGIHQHLKWVLSKKKPPSCSGDM